MSVRECQERVDGDEFTYWKAYNQIDPIGNERQDYQAALVAYTTASAAGGKKKYKFNDFLLNFDKPKRMNNPQEIMKYFKSISK